MIEFKVTAVLDTSIAAAAAVITSASARKSPRARQVAYDTETDKEFERVTQEVMVVLCSCVVLWCGVVWCGVVCYVESYMHGLA